MTPARLTRCTLTLAVCLAWLTGCSSALAPAELGPPYAPIDQARAEALMPLDVLNRAPGVVRVTDDKGEHDQTDTSEPIAEDTWRTRVAGFWIVDVTREPNGAIWILSEAEISEGQRVAYTTPLPMLPESLMLNEPLHSASPIRVYNIGSDAPLASGQCRQTLTLLGTRTIDTPQGQATATLIRARRKYSLPLVSVDVDILTAYVPGQGPAAGINRRVIRFLGLVPVAVEQHVMRIK